MSETYISTGLRRRVAARADGLCEYCLIHGDDTFYGCQVDHIISEKHGGLTEFGEVTEHILGLNRGDRLLERQALRVVGRYPAAAALKRMSLLTTREADDLPGGEPGRG